MKKTKLRKSKNIGKNVILIGIMLIIAITFSQNCLGDEQLKLKEIEVSPNDTLWYLAQDICDNNNKLDIQNVIIDIKEINNLKSSDIYVGQSLYIPEY